MSVPARKKSRSAVRRRRSHHGMKAQNVGLCQACQAPVLPHRACKSCGNYKGNQAVDVSRGQRAVAQAAAQAHTHDHDHDHEPTEATESKESEEKAS